MRLKKGKKRFEVACYKDKVLEYRRKLETNLDEVLQSPHIFLNVSKGQQAPSAEVTKAFGKASHDDIVLEILDKGELQVGERERREDLEQTRREVVSWIAGRLIDPRNRRVYAPGIIEKALDQLRQRTAQAQQQPHAPQSQPTPKRDRQKSPPPRTPGPKHEQLEDQVQWLDLQAEKAEKGSGTPGAGTPKEAGQDGEAAKPKLPSWTGVVLGKDTKRQAQDAMRALIAWQIIPVMRARMKVRVTCHVSMLKQAAAISKKAAGEGEEGTERPTAKGTVKEVISGYVEEVESQGEVAGEWEMIGLVEPGNIKPLMEFVGSETKGTGKVSILDEAIVHEGD